jgi:alginate O-acetyltransferase complex protein AlgJ
MKVNKILFSGLFMLAFLTAGAIPSILHMQKAFAATGHPAAGELMKGTWAAKFEKKFGEALDMYEPSRNFWGRSEYALFQEGRKGVVVGEDGWLFTDEEFSCLPDAQNNFQDNVDFIVDVRDQLKKKNVELIVALIPAKVRVYGNHVQKINIPECRDNLYQQATNFLDTHNVKVADLYKTMKNSNHPDLFLKTDTHWTPKGARISARKIAKVAEKIKIPKKNFEIKYGPSKEHSGDLLRYMPGVMDQEIKPESLPAIIAENADSKAASDLFSDEVPPVTLVGTSYSANPLWNFEGFLKTSLKADVLNMADEGMGPFTVMDKYLKDNVFLGTPPKLVIWEIPERYLSSPHEINQHKT